MNIDKITKQYNKALEIKKGDKYAESKSGKMSLTQLRKGFQTSLPKKILKNAQSNLNSYLILV